MQTTANDRVRRITLASVYPHYVAKAAKKDRTAAEVDEIILWLTGYSPEQLRPISTPGRPSKPSSTRPRP